MKKYDYDYIVIGSGVAGIAGASVAAMNGKKVAVIERDVIGGKNAICDRLAQLTASNISQLLKVAQSGTSYGVNSENLKINLPSMRSKILEVIEKETLNQKKVLKDLGIDLIHETARFLSPIEVAVGEKTLTAKKFLIATGTKLDTGNISGLENNFLTVSDLYLNLTRIPKVSLVIGASQSGCEAAEFLAEMGSSVILVDLADRILPKEDPEVGELIEKYFSEKYKIKVLAQTRVLSIEKNGTQTLSSGRKMNVLKAVLMKAEQEKAVRVECVVLATGQIPELDLGLENAGIRYDRNGIEVSQQMQTSIKHIFAAGGVAKIKNTKSRKSSLNTFYCFEKDYYEGVIATSSCFSNRSKATADDTLFAKVTNTYPKIASIGLTEDFCIASGVKYASAITELGETTAGLLSNFKAGFVKILCNREKKIIGATIVAPNAEIIMQEIAFAIKNDLSVIDIAASPHTKTSLSEVVRITARKLI